MRVFPDEICMWISGLSKIHWPSWYGWASSSPVRAWIEQKAEGGIHPRFFLPRYLSWTPHLILSRPRTGTEWYPLDLVSFGLGLNDTTGFTGSPLCRQQIVRHLSLHNYVSQILRNQSIPTVCVYIYPSIHTHTHILPIISVPVDGDILLVCFVLKQTKALRRVNVGSQRKQQCEQHCQSWRGSELNASQQVLEQLGLPGQHWVVFSLRGACWTFQLGCAGCWGSPSFSGSLLTFVVG